MGKKNQNKLRNKENKKKQIIEKMCTLIPKNLPREVQISLRNQVEKQWQLKKTRSELIQMANQIYSQNIVELYDVLAEYRHFISTDTDGIVKQKEIQFILELNIEKQLFSIMKQQNQCPLILLEAIWIIVNITFGTSQQIRKIIDIETLDILFDLVQNNEPQIQELAVWTVGNIAADCFQFRDYLLEKGFLKQLIEAAFDQYEKESKFSVTYSWTLSNLCRGQVSAKFEYIEHAIDIFGIIIMNSDEQEILEQVCWALKAISDHQQSLQLIINSGVIPKLIKLLDHSIQSISLPALKIIWNILTGNDQQIDFILVQQIDIENLLQRKDKNFVKEVCGCLSNITAGNIQQVHRIIYNKKIMNILIKFIHLSREDIQKQIVWILLNAISKGTEKDAEYLVNEGMIDWFSKLLYVNDNKTISTVLIGIKILLLQGEKLKSQNDGRNPFLDTFLEIFYFLYRIQELSKYDHDQNLQEKAKDLLNFIQK